MLNVIKPFRQAGSCLPGSHFDQPFPGTKAGVHVSLLPVPDKKTKVFTYVHISRFSDIPKTGDFSQMSEGQQLWLPLLFCYQADIKKSEDDGKLTEEAATSAIYTYMLAYVALAYDGKSPSVDRRVISQKTAKRAGYVPIGTNQHSLCSTARSNSNYLNEAFSEDDVARFLGAILAGKMMDNKACQSTYDLFEKELLKEVVTPAIRSEANLQNKLSQIHAGVESRRKSTAPYIREHLDQLQANADTALTSVYSHITPQILAHPSVEKLLDPISIKANKFLHTSHAYWGNMVPALHPVTSFLQDSPVCTERLLAHVKDPDDERSREQFFAAIVSACKTYSELVEKERRNSVGRNHDEAADVADTSTAEQHQRPDTFISKTEMETIFLDAVKDGSIQHPDLIRERIFNNKSTAEVAKQFGISQGEASKRVKKAIKVLRERYGQLQDL